MFQSLQYIVGDYSITLYAAAGNSVPGYYDVNEGIKLCGGSERAMEIMKTVFFFRLQFQSKSIRS